MADPELYDVEAAAHQLAQHRRRNDRATATQVGIADQMASRMTLHYPDTVALDAAGSALVLAAASLGALAAEGVAANVLVNIAAFAGQRMMLDARAAMDTAAGPGVVDAAAAALGDIASAGAAIHRDPATLVPLAEVYAAVEWSDGTAEQHRAALVALAGNVLARLIDMAETTSGEVRPS